MTNPHSRVWNDERVEQLKRLHAEGLSCSGGGEHADQVVLRLEHQRDVSEIEPPRRFKKRGKQLWQMRFEFCIGGHAVAFEAIEIMCGDRSEIVRASHATRRAGRC